MLKKLFSRSPSQAFRPKIVVVVSGLPRSGTSMMMKMLAEGGLEAISDALRSADDDNPNGYFEFEPVKQLGAGQAHWLDKAGGKVVKIISSLLDIIENPAMYKDLADKGREAFLTCLTLDNLKQKFMEFIHSADETRQGKTNRTSGHSEGNTL